MEGHIMDSEMVKYYYSVKEISILLCVSKSLIYDLVYKGEIPVRRVGKRILIPRTYVERFAKS